MNSAALYVGAAGLLFGSAGLASRFAPPGTPAALFGVARLLIGGLVLAALLRPRALLALLKILPLRALAEAALAMALFQWSFFLAVDEAGVGVASLLSAGASPTIADLLPGVQRRDADRSWRRAAGLTALAIPLCALSGASPYGIAWALVSAASYAVYARAAASLEQARAGAGVACTALALLLAGLLLAPAAAGDVQMLLSASGILVAAYLGIAATAVAYWLFVTGLRAIAPARALTILLVQPLAAVVGAAALLHEPLQGAVAAAAACLALATLARALPFRPSLQGD